MKIRISSADRNIRLWFPTGLIFSPMVARLGCRYGMQYAGNAMKNISPDALEALFAEFRRIKKKHGSWNLVDIESTDGEQVKIVL